MKKLHLFLAAFAMVPMVMLGRLMWRYPAAYRALIGWPEVICDPGIGCAEWSRVEHFQFILPPFTVWVVAQMLLVGAGFALRSKVSKPIHSLALGIFSFGLPLLMSFIVGIYALVIGCEGYVGGGVYPYSGLFMLEVEVAVVLLSYHLWIGSSLLSTSMMKVD